MLAIWIYPEEKQTLLILMTGGSFAVWSKATTKVSPNLPQKQRSRDAVSLDICISKIWLPGP